MKNQVLVVLLVLSSLVFAANAHAQTMTFKARVPFPFVIGNQTLPAGNYQIQRLLGRPGEGDQIGMIVIRGTERGVYKAVVTELAPQPDEPRGGSQLVFAKRAGQHYLSEVYVQGEKDQHIPNVSQEPELVGSDASEQAVVLAELH
jgi:hypothetical protein